MGFAFDRQPTTRRLYKFPRTIGAKGPAAMLFVGIDPRRSPSNADLNELVTSDPNAFDELSQNHAFGEPYIATGGRERHYRPQARIAKSALAGTLIEGPPF